jgi:DNA helicase-2/ATP-dependent DNA helicase PcrA
MALVTGDLAWAESDAGIKKLALEHHMAARRMGFLGLFEAVISDDSLRTGFLDGSLAAIRLFTEAILPLREAYARKDQFEIARIVKQFSPIVARENIKESREKMALLKQAAVAVENLNGLWADGNIPTLREIVDQVKKTRLFRLPQNLAVIANRNASEGMGEFPQAVEEQVEEEVTSSSINAWDRALQCSFSEIGPYKEYISDQSPYATHQGVKGLEFPRVMVIIDDDEARGFMFSYDKLFGVTASSDNDRRNAEEGKETSADRTRRLFYVSCSRAKQSLAIVAYTGNTDLLMRNVVERQWFEEDEIQII